MKDFAEATTSTRETVEYNPTKFDLVMSGISLVLFICATSFMWFNV